MTSHGEVRERRTDVATVLIWRLCSVFGESSSSQYFGSLVLHGAQVHHVQPNSYSNRRFLFFKNVDVTNGYKIVCEMLTNNSFLLNKTVTFNFETWPACVDSIHVLRKTFGDVKY